MRRAEGRVGEQIFGVIFAFLTLWGCAQQPPPPPISEATTADSSGVAIVVNPRQEDRLIATDQNLDSVLRDEFGDGKCQGSCRMKRYAAISVDGAAAA